MTRGAHQFQTSKTLEIVSTPEFEEIRQEMINVGGQDLKLAKFLYYGMIFYGSLCLLWWVVYLAWGLSDDKFKGIGVTLTIILTLVPNIIMRFYWSLYMGRASENIQRMFDRQNLASYNIRGIHWGTRRTLLFIYIRIFDKQLRSTGQFLTQPYLNQTPSSSGFQSPSYTSEGRGLISHQNTGLISHHRGSLTPRQNGGVQHSGGFVSHQTENITSLRDTFHAPQQNEYQMSSPDYQMVPQQSDYQMAPQQNEYQMAPSQINYHGSRQQIDYHGSRQQIDYEAPQKSEFKLPNIQVYPQIQSDIGQVSEFGHIQIYPKIELEATKNIQMPPKLEMAKQLELEISKQNEQTGLGLSKQSGLGISKQSGLGISKQNGLEISKQTEIASLKEIEEPPQIPQEAKVQVLSHGEILQIPKPGQPHNSLHSPPRVDAPSNLFSEAPSVEEPSQIELEFPEHEA